MRTLVQRNRNSLACRVAAMALIAGLGSGCSSGFTRFDSSLYTSAAEQAAPVQEYPGVDSESTGSIGRIPVPQGDIYGGGSAVASAGAYSQQTYNTQAYVPVASAPAIERSSLPSPIANAPAYDKPPLLAPASTSKPRNIDPVNTASLAPAVAAASEPVQQAAKKAVASAPAVTKTVAAAPAAVAKTVAAAPAVAKTVAAAPAVAKTVAAAPAAVAKTVAAAPAVAKTVAAELPAKAATTATERGWTATGGTTIALREGETLYNLSKRYGVPVSAILSANNIKDATSVQSGQNIVIPTYVYSRSAPVSAPDNDPAQQSASSARGQLAAERASIAAVAPADQAKTQVASSASAVNAAATSAATVGGARAVKVAAGDSLARIASRNGVSVSALKAANGLTSDNIRIGQVLSLPGAGTATAAAKAATDPVTTAATKANATVRTAADGPKPYVQPKAGSAETASTEPVAPARTGIEEFRWPVRGRVISNFGEKTASGRNDGIDISVPEGTAVKAVENGVVVYAGSELEGLGNLVLIRHADGWVSAYAHNKAIDVNRGDQVNRGQTIARSGRTGNADMPKLHFELRKNSAPVDPLKHLGGA